jgi:hypothetical protein
LAADPIALANPSGDRVDVRGQEVRDVRGVVQAHVKVVGSSRVGRFGGSDQLLDPRPSAEPLEDAQRVGDQDPSR